MGGLGKKKGAPKSALSCQARRADLAARRGVQVLPGVPVVVLVGTVHFAGLVDVVAQEGERLTCFPAGWNLPAVAVQAGRIGLGIVPAQRGAAFAAFEQHQLDAMIIGAMPRLDNAGVLNPGNQLVFLEAALESGGEGGRCFDVGFAGIVGNLQLLAQLHLVGRHLDFQLDADSAILKAVSLPALTSPPLNR